MGRRTMMWGRPGRQRKAREPGRLKNHDCYNLFLVSGPTKHTPFKLIMSCGLLWSRSPKKPRQRKKFQTSNLPSPERVDLGAAGAAGAKASTQLTPATLKRPRIDAIGSPPPLIALASSPDKLPLSKAPALFAPGSLRDAVASVASMGKGDAHTEQRAPSSNARTEHRAPPVTSPLGRTPAATLPLAPHLGVGGPGPGPGPGQHQHDAKDVQQQQQQHARYTHHPHYPHAISKPGAGLLQSAEDRETRPRPSAGGPLLKAAINHDFDLKTAKLKTNIDMQTAKLNPNIKICPPGTTQAVGADFTQQELVVRVEHRLMAGQYQAAVDAMPARKPAGKIAGRYSGPKSAKVAIPQELKQVVTSHTRGSGQAGQSERQPVLALPCKFKCQRCGQELYRKEHLDLHTRRHLATNDFEAHRRRAESPEWVDAAMLHEAVYDPPPPKAVPKKRSRAGSGQSGSGGMGAASTKGGFTGTHALDGILLECDFCHREFNSVAAKSGHLASCKIRKQTRLDSPAVCGCGRSFWTLFDREQHLPFCPAPSTKGTKGGKGATPLAPASLPASLSALPPASLPASLSASFPASLPASFPAPLPAPFPATLPAPTVYTGPGTTPLVTIAGTTPLASTLLLAPIFRRPNHIFCSMR